MTSIHTNVGAISALQTLRSIAGQMGDTQNQVSSGLRVGTASDNAAYWSIATTMRSDNMAISAVEDALGLGAAKTDTAYAGMDSVISVMQVFQAKLVAAKEDGVDRGKVQSELSQLQEQVVSIAQSSSFNGVNWLDTNIPDIYDVVEATDSLTSSFVRSAGGGVSVKTMAVDVSKLSLFNVNGGGLLQRDDRSPGSIGGLRGTVYDFPSSGIGSGDSYTFDGPLAFVDNTTTVSFSLTLDADDPGTTASPEAGTTITYTIDRAAVDAANPGLNGVVSDRAQWRQVLLAVVGPSISISRQSGSTVNYSISSEEILGRGSSYNMSGVTSTLAGGLTGGLVDTPTPSYGRRAWTYSDWNGPFEIKPTVEVYVDIIEDGVGKTLRLTRETVMAALGTSNGKVETEADFITLLNYAFTEQGIGITASDTGFSLIQYDLDPAVHPETGYKSSIGVTGASDNLGTLPDFGFLDIDVTSGHDLDEYISGFQTMLEKVISGASALGALQHRIDLQSSFARRLSDSLDSGIGRLVDADMNEASTRLKALQSQEQLAIQSLSIANTNAEGILTLFR